MRRVTGIGGIFFKAEDPEKMYGWYEKHLGIQRERGFVSFAWRDDEKPEERGLTTWSIFPQTTEYFKPSESRTMINYRVENMEALLEALAAEGVAIVKRENHEYGHFAWIMDPEGNKIELWEPPRETAE